MRNPFKRQKNTDEVTLPKEVQDYYQAEKHERVGVASMLAIGTLLVTLVLAFGIFFGGRWVWRHTLHHNRNNPVATVQAPDDKTSSSSSTNRNSPASTHSSPNSSASSTPSTSSATDSSGTIGTPASGNSSPTTSSAATLPNTGPSTVLPIAFGSLVLGVAAAELYQRRLTKR